MNKRALSRLTATHLSLYFLTCLLFTNWTWYIALKRLNRYVYCFLTINYLFNQIPNNITFHKTMNAKNALALDSIGEYFVRSTDF